MTEGKTVLFSGYSKLPSGTTSSEVFNVMGLVVLVNVSTGEILEAECTLSTRLSEKFVSNLIVGRNLKTGLDQAIKDIQSVYQGNAQKAIITAVRIIFDKYQSYLQHDFLKQ